MLGASEGAFGVDMPVVSKQGSYPGGEGFGVSQSFQVAVETQLAPPEVAFESGYKLTAKDATEHLDGKEEGVAWLDPMGAIERQSAGGHDTMHVRVMFEFLIPGVEHTEEADLGAEMSGIARERLRVFRQHRREHTWDNFSKLAQTSHGPTECDQGSLLGALDKVCPSPCR